MPASLPAPPPPPDGASLAPKALHAATSVAAIEATTKDVELRSRIT
jgi:hypothetical protein